MTRITETTLTASLTTCKSTIGPINTSTTSLDDMDFTHTCNTNLLTMNMTTTYEMEFQHVDSMTTNMITIQSDIDSLTISPTTPLTTNNTEELTALMTGGNVQTAPPEINRLKCLLLQIQHQHPLQLQYPVWSRIGSHQCCMYSNPPGASWPRISSLEDASYCKGGASQLHPSITTY